MMCKVLGAVNKNIEIIVQNVDFYVATYKNCNPAVVTLPFKRGFLSQTSGFGWLSFIYNFTNKTRVF